MLGLSRQVGNSPIGNVWDILEIYREARSTSEQQRQRLEILVVVASCDNVYCWGIPNGAAGEYLRYCQISLCVVKTRKLRKMRNLILLLVNVCQAAFSLGFPFLCLTLPTPAPTSQQFAQKKTHIDKRMLYNLSTGVELELTCDEHGAGWSS